MGLNPGSDLLSHGRTTLSSALSSFTSEFGMGSGGSHSLWPPGKLVVDSRTRGIDLNWEVVVFDAYSSFQSDHQPNYLGVIWSSLTVN